MNKQGAESRYRPPEGMEPRLQRILDKLSPAPAFIKTATWNVVAWNRAATVFWPQLGSAKRSEERNTLRMIFSILTRVISITIGKLLRAWLSRLFART